MHCQGYVIRREDNTVQILQQTYGEMLTEVSTSAKSLWIITHFWETTPLNQHFPLCEKQERKVSVGVGLGEV